MNTVYLLSAQFPGPTTPRDFVTMFLTSDQALQKDESGDCPRHFMVISRPCLHPDTPARDGYIRGQYESVEFIREIPIKKKRSSSTTNLANSGIANARKRSSSLLSREAILRNAKQNHQGSEETGTQDAAAASDTNLARSDSGRARGHTISFDKSRGATAKGERMDIHPDDEDIESNPIEWIMITRSDPGGSVPRFMIERGTPGGIVSDASKFLDWACAKDIDDLESDDEETWDENAEKKDHKHRPHDHERDLHNWQTNGHLAGIEEITTPKSEHIPAPPSQPAAVQNGPYEEKDAQTAYNSNAYSSGLYSMITGAAGLAGGFIVSHAPQAVTDRLPSYIHQPSQEPSESEPDKTTATASLRRDSTSTLSSVSSVGSFASALERAETGEKDPGDPDTSSLQTTQSDLDPDTKASAIKDKELAKLAEKKRKLDEKLEKARTREKSRKSDDSVKEEEAIRKAEEKHEREVKKQEEKYKKEVEKLERKKAKEERKVEERRKKGVERDEKTRVARELEEMRGEVGVLKREREILRGQVGDLQRENTALAVRVGRLGAVGEEVLRDVRQETGKGARSRASSLKGLTREPSFRSGGSGGSAEGKMKENSKLGEGKS